LGVELENYELEEVAGAIRSGDEVAGVWLSSFNQATALRQAWVMSSSSTPARRAKR
jgi:hypothetical protein